MHLLAALRRAPNHDDIPLIQQLEDAIGQQNTEDDYFYRPPTSAEIECMSSICEIQPEFVEMGWIEGFLQMGLVSSTMSFSICILVMQSFVADQHSQA